jgi:putative tricarboxylic transport membrane protein
MRKIVFFVWLLLCASSSAQEWRPERAIEIVAGSAAGGAQDRTARAMQRILKERNLINVAIGVVNKPGGGGTLSQAYLNQHAGDAHYITVASPSLLLNQISGGSKSDPQGLTPLALLFSEYIVIAVRDDSPLKSGRDLVQRLKADPSSVSVAVATARGGVQHVAAGLLTKAAGADVRKLKVVVFNAGSESIAAVLGGHVDIVSTAAANAAQHVQSGRLRVLGVAAPNRLEGLYASAPTWKEQGYDTVASNWRSVLAPKGISAAQTAFWDDTLSRLVKLPEWNDDVKKNYWVNNYLDSRASRAYFASQVDELRGVLGDLLAK